MRIRFIVPVEILNSDFSWNEYIAARAEGKNYPVPRTLPMPAGFESTEPDDWIHCVPGDFNAPARAVPLDEESRAKVNEWMKARSGKLEDIREQLKRAPRNKEEKEAQKALREAYADELGLDEKKKSPA